MGPVFKNKQYKTKNTTCERLTREQCKTKDDSWTIWNQRIACCNIIPSCLPFSPFFFPHVFYFFSFFPLYFFLVMFFILFLSTFFFISQLLLLIQASYARSIYGWVTLSHADVLFAIEKSCRWVRVGIQGLQTAFACQCEVAHFLSETLHYNKNIFIYSVLLLYLYLGHGSCT